jgi:hypothetical protein
MLPNIGNAAKHWNYCQTLEMLPNSGNAAKHCNYCQTGNKHKTHQRSTLDKKKFSHLPSRLKIQEAFADLAAHAIIPYKSGISDYSNEKEIRKRRRKRKARRVMRSHIRRSEQY